MSCGKITLALGDNASCIDRIVFVTWTQHEKIYYHKWLPSVFPLPSTLSYGAALEVEGSSVFLQWAKDSELRDQWMNVSDSDSDSEESSEGDDRGSKRSLWAERRRRAQPKKSPYDVEEDLVNNLIDEMSDEEDCDYGGDGVDGGSDSS